MGSISKKKLCILGPLLILSSCGQQANLKTTKQMASFLAKPTMISSALTYNSSTDSETDPVIFNWKFYLDANPSLRAAGIDTETQAINHWRNSGLKECLRASAEFSSFDYLALNPDIANALGAKNCAGAVEHYLKRGSLENRQKSKPFNYGWQFGGKATPGFGDATFGNEQITFRTSALYSGTVTEIWFRGKQYVNNHDTGRLFQTAFTFDKFGECFNPTEGGNNSDVVLLANDIYKGKSQTILNSLNVSNGSITTNSNPAYWYAPGTSPAPYCGIPQGRAAVSPDLHTKTITMNYGGDRQIVLWQVDVNTATDHTFMSFEALTGYHTGEFSSFYKYDYATKTLVPTPAAQIVTEKGGPAIVGNANHIVPIVAATSDGQHALGVFSFDLEPVDTPDNIIHTTTYGLMEALSATDAADSTTKWSVYYSFKNAKRGKYTNKTFLIFGDLQEVAERMKFLDSLNSNQVISLVMQDRSKSVFDLNYYLTQNPDLKAVLGTDLDPILNHYLIDGLAEGRNAAPNFNGKAYLAQHPELQAKFGSKNFLAAMKYYLTSLRDGGNASEQITPTPTPTPITTTMTCSNGTHLANNTCVSNSQTCSVANGNGSQNWNGSSWSACQLVSCNPGFNASNNACLSTQLVNVYRFFSKKTGEHFFSSSSTEGTNAGFSAEGVAFTVHFAKTATADVALYRCFTGVKHFISINSSCEGSRVEGTYGYVSSSLITGTTALYRFYLKSNGDHLITTSKGEGLNNGYVLEGVLGYVEGQ